MLSGLALQCWCADWRDQHYSAFATSIPVCIKGAVLMAESAILIFLGDTFKIFVVVVIELKFT